MRLIAASDDVKRRVLEEIGQTDSGLNSDIVKIRDWLNKQPHLPKDASDDVLKSFLVAMKSMERAKERLDNFYTSRTMRREIFSNLDPDSFQGSVQQFIMPEMTAEGYRVFYLRLPEDLTAEEFCHISVVRRQMLICLTMMEEDPISGGAIGVYDLKGFSPSVLTRWSISLHNEAVSLLQDSMPIRIKKVIVINCVPVVVKIYENLLKPFIKKKLADRVMLVSAGEEEKMLSVLPEVCVPSDLGGTGETCRNLHEYWEKKLLQKRDWCIQQTEIKVNDALRPKGSKETADSYSVAGNFRALSID